MKKLLFPSMLLMFCLIQFSIISGYGQKDIFKGIFDKEDPVFHPTILASAEDGVINLVYYFSHSKANTLEASIWIKDQGSNLMAEGSKQMVRGLKQINNRQQDTIRIDGLINNHFYTIGIDYRTLNNLSRKFSSTILQEGYRYHFTGPQGAPATVQNEEPKITAKGVSPQAIPQEPVIGQQQQYKAEPCRNPDLTVGIEKQGYCNSGDRPAVLIRCNNCEGRDWKFSVETRQDKGYWEPMRVDGERQAAIGNVIRKEPLCVLSYGTYHVRVLAWGDRCQAPVIMNIPEKLTIEEPYSGAISSDYTKKGTQQEFLPDTCEVSGEAYLDDNIIRGTLKLDLNSPCVNSYAYAKVTYVHPGYRDIPVEPVNLRAGEKSEFVMYLDHKDLSRGIHTIQVATYIRSLNNPTPILKGSFWIKADVKEQNDMAYLNEQPTAYENASTSTNNDYIDVQEYDDPPIIREQMDEIHVKAADPNCPQIQDLEMVFEAGNLNHPLYISWLSPRCCQEEGCEYTIWAGQTPDQVRMMVKGNKPGAKIMEVLNALTPDDKYIEIEVSTSNGNRKAAYIMGEGPKYGIEEVFAYRDQFHEIENEAIKGTVSQPVEPEPEPYVGSSLADRAGGDARVGAAAPKMEQNPPIVATGNPSVGGELAARAGTEVTFAKPTYPISKFKPCKYKRNISIEGDKPIHNGDEITIKYNFSEQGYQYTLYQKPPGGSEWLVAQGHQRFTK